MNKEPVLMIEGLLEKTLADLKVGQETYAVPWAMKVDAHGQCWISNSHTQHKGRGGTVQMLVRRVEGGFAVGLRFTGDYKWHKSNSFLPVPGVPNSGTVGYLPVVEWL